MLHQYCSLYIKFVINTSLVKKFIILTLSESKLVTNQTKIVDDNYSLVS